MFGEAFVDERVVGPQQVQDAPVLAHLAFDEQLHLPHHGFAQRVVKGGVLPGIGLGDQRVARDQPLAGEVRHEGRRTAIGQHAPHLPLQDSRIAQCATLGRRQELVVWRAAPEEERQARGQLRIADPIDGARCGVGAIALDPQEEVRRHEQRFQRPLDAGVEIAGAAAVRVDLEQRPHVGVGHGPPIGAPRERAEDLRRAGILVLRSGRPADEDRAAARCIVGRGCAIRPGDFDSVDAGMPGIIGGHRELDRSGPRGHPLPRRGRRVGERHGHQARPRLDDAPQLHVVVGRQAVAVALLPFDVVLRDANRKAGVESRELAADVEAFQ